MIAVVDPGAMCKPSTVRLLEDGVESATLSADAGLEGLLGLIDLAVESFGAEVVEWRLVTSGYGSALLGSDVWRRRSKAWGLVWVPIVLLDGATS